MSRFSLLYLTVIVFVGCTAADAEPKASYSEITGEVAEIRVVVSGGSKGNSAIGPAIAGALLGGTTGAIIGSTMGSPASTREKPEACRIHLKMDSTESVVFPMVTNRENLLNCGLLRVGDSLAITKLVKNGTTSYMWGNAFPDIGERTSN